jgi:hypothetical protein
MFLYVVLLSFEVQQYLIVVESFSLQLPCRNMLLCDHGRAVLTMSQVNEGLRWEMYKVYETIFERALAVHDFRYM